VFTLYHLGQEVGSTDFAHAGSAPNQRLGAFLPTPYGTAFLPRITGLLEAGLELKLAMEREGIDPDADPDAITSALETLPEGRRLLDVGRATTELELRNEHGVRVPFSSLAISDVREMMALARRDGREAPALPDDLGEWSYLISATFAPARVPDVAAVASWLRRPGSRN
jgi:hypothetical protein